ncbi:hypothetical protein BpHYR1_000980 [Brachionus plicatilis]|uniref:Uncharacterized protein n=1 Tax=Brachionus plicatilis TaxID=10195 RepID=A0A3M7T3Z4_BRAPC|nr:hypothetical protein BpHYR1_000980 [Brachionus plicatilis]
MAINMAPSWLSWITELLFDSHTDFMKYSISSLVSSWPFRFLMIRSEREREKERYEKIKSLHEFI